jgi:hypothetical protein
MGTLPPSGHWTGTLVHMQCLQGPRSLKSLEVYILLEEEGLGRPITPKWLCMTFSEYDMEDRTERTKPEGSKISEKWFK